VWHQIFEHLGVASLTDLEEIADGLESLALDVKVLILKCHREDVLQVIFVLGQMVSDVGKKTGKKLKSGVNLTVYSTVDLLENKVEKVLPDSIIFMSLHSTLNLNSQVGNLVNNRLSGTSVVRECFDHDSSHFVACCLSNCFPEVCSFVLEVLEVSNTDTNVPSEDDG
jgi:hypothetical protein